MNKRIQELAKQAGAHWNHGDFNMGSSVEFQEGDLENFAQLIIEECAKFIDEKSDHDNFVAKVAPLLAKP